jgi:DNA anti-recombination protein RmuC
MQAVSGIGEFIMGIANAMKTFSTIKDTEALAQKVGESVVKIMDNFQAGFKKITATPDSMSNFISGYKDFFEITKGFAELVDPMERIATSFEKIGTSIAGIKTTINDIDFVKMAMSKSFLDSIIEIDKINLNDFQDKMKSVKEAIEAASKANVERLDQLSKVQQGGDKELKATLDQLVALMQAGNSTMANVASVLSGTLKVDVLGDGLGRM